MLKFNIFPIKTLTHLNCLPSPQPSPSSVHFDSTSFEASYLINNFDFSPQRASKLCSTYRLAFKTAQNPDSVINFFTDYGFSNSQLRHIVAKEPWLLSCDFSKRVLPKFLFFLSKGASIADVVNIVSRNPRVLRPSLENHIAPTYELLYRYAQSDRAVIASAIQNPDLLYHPLVPRNITTLIENGVAHTIITRILRQRNRTFQVRDMVSLVEELKDLGFNPSNYTFGAALIAKASLPKTRWSQKVDTYKKWGWSDQDVIEAFKKQPNCMLTSIDKINLVMNFWVNQLSWDALALAKHPTLFCLSLEKRIIPRASVVQFLLMNGLRNKYASLTSPFFVTEKVFLDRFIKRFEKESSYLLNLYEEKLKLAGTKNASHD
ncbi:uncharacterized protein LOC127138394 isoform X1 [Lathyrus oleraceus]|uniref:mTERF protein n=2 Tax=Pisum sativum TaxID=3888 RepID=A0A9D5GYV8_PEA|nr:uncharacterized protein LOC127138394 isoform X1 [Pisum sativum]KAI5446325.1 hypothetical protein KIW84_014242 [Pisum sativum]